MKKRTILFATITTLVLTIFATGCTQSTTGNVSMPEAGQIVLSVNPEIAVHYNKEGLVTKIEGINNDGNIIVSGVNNYIGRNCREVVTDLVKEINESGYFVVDENGVYNNITIHVVPGSHIPNSKFLDHIADDVRQTVNAMNLNTTVAVHNGETDYGKTDYNGNSQYGNSNSNNSNYNDSFYGNSGYNNPSITITSQPNNNGNSAYNDSAYGNSGYNSPSITITPQPNNNNNSGYNDSGYNDSGYGNSNYNNSAYGGSNNSGYGNS